MRLWRGPRGVFCRAPGLCRVLRGSRACVLWSMGVCAWYYTFRFLRIAVHWVGRRETGCEMTDSHTVTVCVVLSCGEREHMGAIMHASRGGWT